MGDLFSQGGIETNSTLSGQQQSLLGPLRDFILPYLQNGGNNSQIDQLMSQLMSSGSAESRAMSERVFTEGLLGPALRGYDQQIAPRINESFAKIGGTLSSRRGTTSAQALTDITANATGQLAQMLPQIQAFPLQQTLNQIQGASALQSMRFQPFSQALQFALSPTQQSQQTQEGAGWGLLGSGITAAGFALGGPLGGAAAGGVAGAVRPGGGFFGH